MSNIWNVGDRCVLCSTSLPPNENPYDKPRDLLGVISDITFRYLRQPGNQYIVKLDIPIKHYGGTTNAVAVYTAQHLRKRY